MVFSVATYNVLADAYLRPEWFPATPRRLLDPQWRRPALAGRVVGLGADVVCLQEAEPDSFAAVAAALGPAGYAPSYAPKGQNKPDGCATFVRTSAFTVEAVRTIHYADGAGVGPDSGHVALLVVLRSDGRRVGVANTHLKWHAPGTPPAEQLGRRQLVELLAEIRTAEPPCPTWVVVGDFNVTADSDVVALLTQAGFADAYRDRPGDHTCNPNRRAKRIDYLFHTADLCARPVPLPAIDDHTPLPSPEEPSDHLPVMAWFDWSDPSEERR